MKIVALTDIHGAYDVARDIIQHEPADVLILGGDLTTVGSVKEAADAVASFKTTTNRLVCIAGNMDLPQHDDVFVNLGISINGRGLVIDDVGFFGVSGAPHSPLHTPYEISEEEIMRRSMSGYLEVKRCIHTVFVPHAPPYGTRLDIIHTGIHVGSTAVRDFIEEIQPTIAVCGHIHEARGRDHIEKTALVNCGAASHGNFAVIEIGKSVQIRLSQRHPTSFRS